MSNQHVSCSSPPKWTTCCSWTNPEEATRENQYIMKTTAIWAVASPSKDIYTGDALQSPASLIFVASIGFYLERKGHERTPCMIPCCFVTSKGKPWVMGPFPLTQTHTIRGFDEHNPAPVRLFSRSSCIHTRGFYEDPYTPKATNRQMGAAQCFFCLTGDRGLSFCFPKGPILGIRLVEPPDASRPENTLLHPRAFFLCATFSARFVVVVCLYIYIYVSAGKLLGSIPWIRGVLRHSGHERHAPGTRAPGFERK